MNHCRARTSIVLLFLAATWACGDPDTYDDRGYTKAPLEDPAVLIGGEEPSPMRQFGEPNLPPTEPIELPDSASD